MKTMKFLARRVSALVLVATIGLAALVPAAFAAPASLPDLPKDQCVVDDANVLSSSTVQTIQDLNTQLDASCKGAQIGVLTVDYTGSVSTEDYAVEAANTWGLGSSSENNGVLILLVMQSPEYADGDYYLTYGDGFRNTTLASQASTIAQTMEDDFASQNYDGAVTTCARNVANTIADIYGVSLSGSTTSNVAGGNYNYTDNYHEAPVAKPAFWETAVDGLFTILAYGIVIIALFFMFVVPFGHSAGWYWGPFGWFGWRHRRGPRRMMISAPVRVVSMAPVARVAPEAPGLRGAVDSAALEWAAEVLAAWAVDARAAASVPVAAARSTPVVAASMAAAVDAGVK